MDASTKGFDAGSLVLGEDATTEVSILDRMKKPTGMFITVYSKESDLYRAASRKQQNKRLRTMSKGRGLSITAEENEAENLELMSICTKSWRTHTPALGNVGATDAAQVTLHGQQMACSPANAKVLYTEVLLIREQVEDAINDSSLFQ